MSTPSMVSTLPSTSASPTTAKPIAFVVGEPTGLDVCNAARGQFEGRVTVHGTNAHAATPEAGDNAVLAAAPILEAMDTFDEAVGTPAHETLGGPTLTPTFVWGGRRYRWRGKFDVTVVQ